MLGKYLKNYVFSSGVKENDTDTLTNLWIKHVANKGTQVDINFDIQYIKEKVEKALILYNQL